MMITIKLTSEFITLGQLLKITDCIGSGGEARHFLTNNKIYVNNELDQRRGRKLYAGDRIDIPTFGSYLLAQ